MTEINIPIDILRKFFASAYGLREPGSFSSASGGMLPDVVPVATTTRSSEVRSKIAKAAADARHSRPGGSREKRVQIRELWASGRYTSRDRCAEEECGALGMSFSAARKALRQTPDPIGS